MKSRFMKFALMAFVSTAILPVSLADAQPVRRPSFTLVWNHFHDESGGQVSEIPAYDSKTNTIWVAGVVGVDVLNADNGTRVAHIDVTAHGLVNSVAIFNGLAALAIEAGPPNRSVPGKVVFYNTKTRLQSGAPITVGSLPDMLTFTPDGRKVLVANEGTPNTEADEDYEVVPDPPGSVSIIDVANRTLVATAGLVGVPQFGSDLRTNAGMDFEPEYIAVEPNGARAYVTLEEANGIAVLDLRTNAFTHIVGLGTKDFSIPGNEIDHSDEDDEISFETYPYEGLYMPDTIAAYKWRGGTYLVMANEGDFREDGGDEERIEDLDEDLDGEPEGRLQVLVPPSVEDDYYAAGGRSFSIRDDDGTVIYDSGSILDREADNLGLYDDGRSDAKGMEPEGVALLEMRGRTYAFIGLERTLKSAVAVFDITNPYDVTFLEMIVNDDARAPEGLVTYMHQGKHYLVIANEETEPTVTSLYRVNP